MTDPVEKLDTRRRIELAEGVEVNLRIAGPMVRAYAFMIDLVIRSVIVGVGSMVLLFLGVAIAGQVGVGLILLLYFLTMWFYMILFEQGRKGATPGKRLMKLRVVQPSGAPITFSQAVVRNLLRFADMMPLFTYGIGVLTALFTKRFQRLGDLAADTLVVYDEPFKVPSAGPIPTLTGAVVPPFSLTRAEEAAIVAFAERATVWSDERKNELAEILTEMTGKRGAFATEHIVQMGQWLNSEK